ncbi:MAG TPA: HIT domain-containing protein [Pirellulales bacterium]|nr:HIT domain-containing protein [Pirellulales bacterium]
MSNEKLWAPWRLAYIADLHRPEQAAPAWTPPPGADANCFMCRAAHQQRDRENLVVHRGPTTVAILNRYPYNAGHVLVAPRDHLGWLAEIPAAVQLEAMQQISRLTVALQKLMNADGFNIGLNLGRAAGAGWPGHLHWHVVPRWPGDTNFMPVIGSVDVISQSLDVLWEMLSEALADESSSSGNAPTEGAHD